MGLGSLARSFGGLGVVIDWRPNVRVRVFVGLSRLDSANRLQFVDVPTAEIFIRDVFRRLFPYGSTHLTGRGAYRMASGRQVTEPAVVAEAFEFIFDDADAAGLLESVRWRATCAARLFAYVFGQESCLVELAGADGRPALALVYSEGTSLAAILSQCGRELPPGRQAALRRTTCKLLPRESTCPREP